jgi:hypothetical protein
MPELRAKQTSPQASLDALDAAHIAHDSYPKLAENLERFLARLRNNADSATVEDRQKSATQRGQRSPRRARTRHHPPQLPVETTSFLSRVIHCVGGVLSSVWSVNPPESQFGKRPTAGSGLASSSIPPSTSD